MAQSLHTCRVTAHCSGAVEAQLPCCSQCMLQWHFCVVRKDLRVACRCRSATACSSRASDDIDVVLHCCIVPKGLRVAQRLGRNATLQDGPTVSVSRALDQLHCA